MLLGVVHYFATYQKLYLFLVLWQHLVPMQIYKCTLITVYLITFEYYTSFGGGTASITDVAVIGPCLGTVNVVVALTLSVLLI